LTIDHLGEGFSPSLLAIAIAIEKARAWRAFSISLYKFRIPNSTGFTANPDGVEPVWDQGKRGRTVTEGT
jgi:hypothetical protein